MNWICFFLQKNCTWLYKQITLDGIDLWWKHANYLRLILIHYNIIKTLFLIRVIKLNKFATQIDVFYPFTSVHFEMTFR